MTELCAIKSSRTARTSWLMLMSRVHVLAALSIFCIVMAEGSERPCARTFNVQRPIWPSDPIPSEGGWHSASYVSTLFAPPWN